MPEAVGVPEMVIVFEDQAADTPEGKPVAAPIPVAFVVVCVMFVINVLTHTLGDEEAAEADAVNETVIVPVAFTAPHPPVNGIE